jgi:hypothetical protein
MLKGEAFQPLLKAQAGQWISKNVTAHIFQPQFNHDPSIGKGSVAQGWRHAVDDNRLWRRGRWHNEASRTHAEGVDAPIVRLMHKGIGRGWQKGYLCGLPMILNRIDEGLWMFDAHPHRKGFGLKPHALSV